MIIFLRLKEGETKSQGPKVFLDATCEFNFEMSRQSFSNKLDKQTLDLKGTLQETNIFHLGKRKIIFKKCPLVGDMMDMLFP